MELKSAINQLLSEKPDAVIAIDGMCASGKSTLARELSQEFGFQVVHTDDFFLPVSMRTAERLSQAGGNIHYERLIEEVIIPLQSKTDFSYRIFSCKTGDYSANGFIKSGLPVIIEGSYSVHPAIPDVFDLKIFSQTDRETQLGRIEKRNGAQALEVFKEKWIVFENRYFEAFSIKEKCDIVIKS